MKGYCVFTPKKGKETFGKLRGSLGYETAKQVFLQALDPQFQKDYKLELDKDGVPTYESIVGNSYMEKFIGDAGLKKVINRDFPAREDTFDNFTTALEEASNFNRHSAHNQKFTAVVGRTDAGKLRVSVVERTPDVARQFANQYASHLLNRRLMEVFEPLGLSHAWLTNEEVAAGRVGVTDFNKAKDMALGFESVIRIANNMEGALALGEEFSHFLVGLFRDSQFVTRAVNALQADEKSMREILGDEYDAQLEYHNGDMALLAEEALGKVLHESLLNRGVQRSLPARNLLQRLYDWIVSKFRGFNADDVTNAVNEAEATLGGIAADIIEGRKSLSEYDIANAQREASFNALSDRIERNINMLKEARKTEAKRTKLIRNEGNRERVAELIKELGKDMEGDTAVGIARYADVALQELKSLHAQFKGFAQMDPEDAFAFLRRARSYMQSYAPFIDALNNAMNEEESEETTQQPNDSTTQQDNTSTPQHSLKNQVTIDGNEMLIPDMLRDLNHLSKSLAGQWNAAATKAFTEFLKPFFGESVEIAWGKDKGKRIDITTLIREAEKDITFLDRWLDSMADSSDVLLQLFDKVKKEADAKIRVDTIEEMKEIVRLREKAEGYGITDYEWMFEKTDDGKKSGHYIRPVNEAQFEKDRREFNAMLDEKYGKNPTGEARHRKMAERTAWRSEHCVSEYFDTPSPAYYSNPAYYALSEKQREILDGYLALKRKMDRRYEGMEEHLWDRAIQMRKTGGSRIWESVTHPSTLFANVKEAVNSALFDREDDDATFGDVRKGLIDFSGKQFMQLPIIFTTMLQNTDDVTTDVFSALSAYSYATNRYSHVSGIVDPLEVGRALVSEQRKTKKKDGGRGIIERIKGFGVDEVNEVTEQSTNIEKKLEDFMESKVYMRFLKDQGSFDLFGKKVNVQKATSLWLKFASLAQLGFNWLANTANVATGIAMQNIESAAGQYFNMKELAKADREYATLLGGLVRELGSREKSNKLDLFFDLFDIHQKYSQKVGREKKKNVLARIFGSEIAFLGQEAGDHWLYGRTGIAMAMRERVLLDGREMSLWDALQPRSIDGISKMKELNYKDIRNLDGTAFNIRRFSNKVAHVNQGLFGVYSTEDANAANRVAMGRLLQQYRKWMKSQYNKRFQAGQYNVAMEDYEEGYYRTVARILNNIRKGEMQISSVWEELSDEERYNVKRALVEVAQVLAIWAICNFLDWPDDKERPWAMKFAEYSSRRLLHETGALAPTLFMPSEFLKIVKNPVPSASQVNAIYNLFSSVIDPRDWVDETKSGQYKGLSTLEKNFMKAPIPGVAQWKQISKFTKDIDASIDFFAKPW